MIKKAILQPYLYGLLWPYTYCLCANSLMARLKNFFFVLLNLAKICIYKISILIRSQAVKRANVTYLDVALMINLSVIVFLFLPNHHITTHTHTLFQSVGIMTWFNYHIFKWSKYQMTNIIKRKFHTYSVCIIILQHLLTHDEDCKINSM